MSLTYTSYSQDEVALGDVVSVNIPSQRATVREGVVIGSHYDGLGRLILRIQFEPGVYYDAITTQVQKVRRTTTYYQQPALPTRRYVQRYLEY